MDHDRPGSGEERVRLDRFLPRKMGAVQGMSRHRLNNSDSSWGAPSERIFEGIVEPELTQEEIDEINRIEEQGRFEISRMRIKRKNERINMRLDRKIKKKWIKRNVENFKFGNCKRCNETKNAECFSKNQIRRWCYTGIEVTCKYCQQ